MPLIAFNSTAPANAGVVLPDSIEYCKHDWKYADAGFVYEGLPKSLQQIVDQAPLVGGYKRTLIDMKVQDLVPTTTSCIAGWHLDGPSNPMHDSRGETHHLFIHGGGATEFVDQSLMIRVTPDMNQRDLVAQIPEDVAVMAIPEDSFNTFTRWDFHRGINVDKPTRRLLIRLTETDIVLPRNKPYTRSVGAR